MKNIILYVAVSIITYAIRLRGWTNEPKPPPYPQSDRTPWWRWVKPNQIESTDLGGAIRASIKDLETEWKETAPK